MNSDVLELVAERGYEEGRLERLAQAHIDNGERECEECGEWTDEGDMARYWDQDICPDCYREYVLADAEELVKHIRIAFGGKAAEAAEELFDAIRSGV